MLSKLLEVTESTLQRIIQSVPVDIHIIMNQNVAKASQRHQALCKLAGDIFRVTKNPEDIAVLTDIAQPVVSHEVTPDVEHHLDRKLRITLRISVHKRVGYESFPRLAPDPLQHLNILTELRKSL